jgi:flagellin
MGLVVNTNTQSLFAQRALFKNTFNMQKSIEKLSTGFKINRAGDDAAGLTIAEKMTAEIRGLEKAKQNSLDGVSLIQTAEGALGVIQDNVQRIRELVVQAANGTNGPDEKSAIQKEITERKTTITSIADGAKFNGQNLLDNSTRSFTLQTGANNGETTAVAINFDASSDAGNAAAGLNNGNTGANDDTTATGFNLIDVTAADFNSTGALLGLDNTIKQISSSRSSLGALQNSLESKIEYIDVAHENVSSSRSRIKDVDVARESSVMVKNQILQQSAAAMLGQANSSPQLALNLLP